MKLPPGATGFAAPAPNEADLGAFTAICYHAARAINGAVTHVVRAGVTPNFHIVDIAHGEHHTAVLRHTVLPLVAFARSAGDSAMTFVDHSDLAAAIAEASDLQVLTTSQLLTPLSRVDLSALDQHERDQISYWKPNTTGELLFNYWD
ncbi:hypothetical protein [Actinopolymorpha pittospori]